MSFKAKYKGRCGSDECEDPIEVGDDVVYEEEKVLVHTRCLFSVSVPSGIPVCKECHLEHKGDCF